jgi:hypothetical protein
MLNLLPPRSQDDQNSIESWCFDRYRIVYIGDFPRQRSTARNTCIPRYAYSILQGHLITNVGFESALERSFNNI